MAPPKGKPATKGQKLIYEENKSTLKFYGIMALVSEIIYISTMLFFFNESFTFFYWCLAAFTIIVYGGALQFMAYMAKPTFGETGSLLDGGIDLNMESGISEHLKDLIIMTTAVQLISLVSNYFWFLWLAAPGRACYLLWVGFLAPWFFQPAPPEVDEKKQKKMERRAKRQ